MHTAIGRLKQTTRNQQNL